MEGEGDKNLERKKERQKNREKGGGVIIKGARQEREGPRKGWKKKNKRQEKKKKAKGRLRLENGKKGKQTSRNRGLAAEKRK